jgi:predicted S18 family serine protease
MADSEKAAALLAYAEERMESASSWSKFFGLPGQAVIITEATLKRSCLQKISEAEERLSYVQTYFPDVLQDAQRSIERARLDAANKSYALCLSKASKAKADADSVLISMGAEEDHYDDITADILRVAERELVAAQEQGYFPLIGYSYYQYAQDLRDEDPASALVFANYATELSNLDMYFKRRSWLSVFDTAVELPLVHASLILFGLVLAGFALGRLVSRKQFKPSPTPLAKRRRGKKR